MSSSPASVTTASVVSGAVASSPYFSSDRAAKYGWGLPRLVLVCLIAFELAPRASSAISPASQAALGLLPYLRSGRWIGHLYIGSIGAAVNVQIRSFTFNLCMLIGAAALIVFDLRLDYAILIYMLKTFSGDFIAGKLDTLEWRLVLLFTGLVAVAAWQLEAANAPVAFQPYTRILPVLATVQLICELGDAHLEHWLFFRHRYSFEVLSLLVLFGLQLTPQELPPVQHDLVICLGYRASNLAIILARSGELMEASRRLAFHLLGLLSGTRIHVVSDITVAMAVLRGSSIKGHALERLIASPAWAPVLSLESIDGPLHALMIADFHKLLAALPPASTFADVAKRRVDALLVHASATGTPIDAEAIARLTVLSFCRYLFGKGAGGAERDSCVAKGADGEAIEAALVQRLVDGSWEWRMEIAVRGRASAEVKAAAVEALLTLLRDSELWSLHEEKWALPRYYSLLMQPFLLSPAINMGDIAVAMHANPSLSPEDAIRRNHPFPILERFVGPAGTRLKDGSLAVHPNTQVIMFTPDFASSKEKWPIFGAGPRACQGASFAQPFIQLMHSKLLPYPGFQPAAGHRFSGRNNDDQWGLGELRYYVGTVAGALLTSEATRNHALLLADEAAKAEMASSAATGKE